MNKSKQIGKRIVDLAMIVLLPLLMVVILIRQEIHEWLGTVMLVLFALHHLLNLGWWKSFVKGKYTPSRTFSTALDLLLLLDMAALCVSGIMMSGFVFHFLNISGGMMIARQLHLFASHWGLILMSAHLGIHMGQFFPLFRKMFHLSEKNVARAWVLRIVAIVLSAYGVYAFITQHMTDYLFLQTHFVLFDETKAAIVYFAEILVMMCMFAAVAYYINKLLHNVGQKSKKEQSNGRIHKVAAFVVPVLVCVLVVVGLNLPAQNAPWQGNPVESPEESSSDTTENTIKPSEPGQSGGQTVSVEDGFVLVGGGSFAMGSPEDEPWRSADETRHTVTVSDFYMSPYEVRQSEYTSVMGNNPSNFGGNDLPVENVSWLDAIAFCNALSVKENLIPAYTVNGETVTWDRSANGYRLPTLWLFRSSAYILLFLSLLGYVYTVPIVRVNNSSIIHIACPIGVKSKSKSLFLPSISSPPVL